MQYHHGIDHDVMWQNDGFFEEMGQFLQWSSKFLQSISMGLSTAYGYSLDHRMTLLEF
jgi:hypothetical protein